MKSDRAAQPEGTGNAFCLCQVLTEAHSNPTTLLTSGPRKRQCDEERKISTSRKLAEGNVARENYCYYSVLAAGNVAL